MKEICPKNQCVGCGACQNVCPQNAVELTCDNEGFGVSSINSTKCDDCQLCLKICPQKNPQETNPVLDVYAFQLFKDNPSLIESTSGGAFWAIANEVITNRNGSVFCAAFDSSLQLRHKKFERIQDIAQAHGSKYVKSKIDASYQEAEQELKAGKTVLFVGLPCQIAGLKSFLQKDYSNLWTVDLLCYGVPSQAVFDSFIRSQERRYNAKVIDVAFRDKHRYGWSHTFVLTLLTKSGIIKKIVQKNWEVISYYQAFANKLFFRNVCYSCQYTKTKRLGDITLANFWEIERFSKKFDASLGVSLVLLNSSKGKEIFDSAKSMGQYEIQSLDHAQKYNGALHEPASCPSARKNILNDWHEKGWDFIEKKYLKRYILIYYIKSIPFLSRIKKFLSFLKSSKKKS